MFAWPGLEEFVWFFCPGGLLTLARFGSGVVKLSIGNLNCRSDVVVPVRIMNLHQGLSNEENDIVEQL